MTCSLVRIFNRFGDAQNARTALLFAGFPKDRVSLITKTAGGGTLLQDSNAPGKSTGGLTDNEVDHVKTVKLERMARRSFLVAVAAVNDSQCSQAADIINKFDPMDANGTLFRTAPAHDY